MPGIFKKLKSLFKPAKKVKPKKKAPVKKRPTKKPSTEKSLKSKGAKPKKKTLGRIANILKAPHISEKAVELEKQNKYVFRVYPKANKIQAKKAIEDLYGVEVKNVNIINVPKKNKILQGIKGSKSGYKKAIVTLEKGQKIEILPH